MRQLKNNSKNVNFKQLAKKFKGKEEKQVKNYYHRHKKKLLNQLNKSNYNKSVLPKFKKFCSQLLEFENSIPKKKTEYIHFQNSDGITIEFDIDLFVVLLSTQSEQYNSVNSSVKLFHLHLNENNFEKICQCVIMSNLYNSSAQDQIFFKKKTSSPPCTEKFLNVSSSEIIENSNILIDFNSISKKLSFSNEEFLV